MTKKNVITVEFDEQGRALRSIRSFVRRQGRLTKGQQTAMDNYWPHMGVEFANSLINFDKLFGNTSPVVLEIGFGMGASLVEMATHYPDLNYLGIEVHLPGVGACLALAHEANCHNLRLMCHDAIEVLNCMIPDESLERVQLFFPDPWQKARHHKRRIVQIPFAQLIRQKLKTRGVFHMATDWQNYAEHMLEIMQSVEGYRNLAKDNLYVERPDFRPLTKFEQRGHRLGHGVWDLMFEKID